MWKKTWQTEELIFFPQQLAEEPSKNIINLFSNIIFINNIEKAIGSAFQVMI